MRCFSAGHVDNLQQCWELCAPSSPPIISSGSLWGQAASKPLRDSWGGSGCLYNCGLAVPTLQPYNYPPAPLLWAELHTQTEEEEEQAGRLKAAFTLLHPHGWSSVLQPGLLHAAAYKLQGVQQESPCLTFFWSSGACPASSPKRRTAMPEGAWARSSLIFL